MLLNNKQISKKTRFIRWARHGRLVLKKASPLSAIDHTQKITDISTSINKVMTNIHNTKKTLTNTIVAYLENILDKKKNNYIATQIITQFKQLKTSFDKLEILYSQNILSNKLQLTPNNYFEISTYLRDDLWNHKQLANNNYEILLKQNNTKDKPINLLVTLIHAHFMREIKDIALEILTETKIQKKDKLIICKLIFSENFDPHDLAAYLSKQTNHLNANGENIVISLKEPKKVIAKTLDKTRFSFETLATLNEDYDTALHTYFKIEEKVNNDKNRTIIPPLWYLTSSAMIIVYLLFSAFQQNFKDTLKNIIEDKKNNIKAVLIIDKTQTKPKPIKIEKFITKYKYVDGWIHKRIPYFKEQLIQKFKTISYYDDIVGKITKKVPNGFKTKKIKKYRTEKSWGKKRVPYKVLNPKWVKQQNNKNPNN